MRSGLVRVLAAAIAVLTVFWLGYAAGRVQDVAELSQRYRDADTDRYSLTRGGVLVHFERLGGGGKPYIRASDGIDILEISDWDRQSRVLVDGTPHELIRLYPRSAVDYERYRVAASLHGDGWLIEREISLDPDGNVEIKHAFVARRPVRRVDLSVAHVRAHFLSIELGPNEVVATVNRLTSEELAGGMQAPPAYRLWASLVGNGALTSFRRGDLGLLGVRSFVADLSVSDPPEDRRVPLGRELIRIEPIAP